MGQIAPGWSRRLDACDRLADEVGWDPARLARPAQGELTLAGAEGPRDEPEPGSRSSGPLPRGHGELVLLADDDEQVQRMVVRSLERGGYRVIAVGDGDAALAAFLTHRAEILLVIADVQMPGRGGRELAAAIHAVAPEVRVILASGHLPASASPPEGVAAYLIKPFVPAELLSTVGRVLGRE